MPKYSIIIPAYNGMPYLKNCVESIIFQKYDDYELILSEDHSSDGTAEYIDSLKDEHIIKLHCPERMSMAEHWEFAQGYASGDWQIFVGQDDALQSYFFELADKLVSICDKKHLNVIMSERAYYLWPGCDDVYGTDKVNYIARKEFKILKTAYELENALYRKSISYMDFPSMYTTSLFRKTFIENIKNLQNRKLFTTHPQDANLAALVAVFQRKYLKSYIPIGWVGSSPKSAGLAISNFGNSLSKDYLKVTTESRLPRHLLAGKFEFSSHPVYFWGALLSISEKFDLRLYKKLISPKIKRKVLSAAYDDVTENNSDMFEYLMEVNGLSLSDLDLMHKYRNLNLRERICRKLFPVKVKNLQYKVLIKQNNKMDDFMKINNNIGMEVRKLFV